MGWSPDEVGRPQFLIVSTQGGLRDADGSPIALGYHTGHWEIGLLVRAAAETLRAEGGLPFAVYLQRSLRRAHPGDGGHVRQPPLPQRRRDHHAASHPLAAAPGRRHGDRHLRQGAARHAARARRLPRSAGHRRAGRRDPAGDRRRGRRQGPDHRRALRARPHHARGGGDRRLPRLRNAGRRMSVPGHSRDLAGGGGGLRADVAAQRALPLGRAGLAGHGPALGARARAPGRGRRRPCRDDPDARMRSRTRCCCTRRSADRRTCCCTSPRSRTRPGWPRPTVEDWIRINRATPRLVDALPNGPRNHPDRAGVHGGRRPRGDAAPARDGPAPPRRPDGQRAEAGRGARLVGGERPAAAVARDACGGPTASIPTP